MPQKHKTTRRKIVRRRKKKSFFNGFLFSTIAFFSILVFSALGFVLFAPNFQIKELNITGNSDVSSEDLKRVAEEQIKTSFSVMGMDFTTESIFLSWGKGVDTFLKAFPQIESVSIAHNFPNGLSINIVEKTPFASWCEKFDTEKCYLVDKSGSYIKDIASISDTGNILKIEEKDKIDLEKKDILSSLAKINEGLSSDKVTIEEYELLKDRININSNLKCQIIFSFGDDLDWQIEKFKIVTKNEKYSSSLNTMNYIDLRFGNQAIIK